MGRPASAMSLPVFVFDFGGVVIKWKSNRPIFEHIARKYHVPQAEMTRALEEGLPGLEAGETPTRELLRESLARFGVRLVPGDSPDELWTAPFERGMRLRSGAVGIVRSLRRRGYRVYLFSNTSSPHASLVRRKGIDRIFDGFIASCEIGNVKPRLAAFEAALGRIGVGPEDVVFVDDREENVRGARAAGIARAYRYTTLPRLRRYVSSVVGGSRPHVRGRR